MLTTMRAGDFYFGAAAAFLFGVFVANMHWNIWQVVVIAGIFLMIARLFFMSQKEWSKPVIFFFCAVVAGVLYYHAYVGWQAAHTKLPAGKQAAFFGLITEEPKAAGNFTMLMVDLSRPYAGTLDIFTSPNNSQFHYGDEVWIKGSVSTSSDANEPSVLFLPKLHVIAQHQGFWLKEFLINIKAAIVQKIAQALPPDQAALLAGIIIGTAGTVSATLKAQMEASGTTYIVNLYGYKIAIITFGVTAALKDHLSRRMLLWVTLGVVAAFVFASGGTISVIRAAIMGSFAIIARGAGRVFSPRNAVTFAALGMVVQNATLLTDAAFQLSFLSFLGIFYLRSPINNLFHWTDPGILQWKEHAMLSLTTNLAIIPIVMNTFGEFSLTSFISNVFIMIPWLAVIAFGALMVLLGFIAPPLAFCAAQIVSVLLRYELFIIHLFATVTVNVPAVFGSTFAIVFYYGILIIFAYYYGAPSQENN